MLQRNATQRKKISLAGNIIKKPEISCHRVKYNFVQVLRCSFRGCCWIYNIIIYCRKARMLFKQQSSIMTVFHLQNSCYKFRKQKGKEKRSEVKRGHTMDYFVFVAIKIFLWPDCREHTYRLRTGLRGSKVGSQTQRRCAVAIEFLHQK